MSDRFEVRFAGSGGQGVITAAVILGEAGVLFSGINTVQTQSYGPEARGGASKAEVVLSKGEIDYPKCTKPDLEVILTQTACTEYAKDVAAGGILILDDFYVTELPNIDAEIYHLPIVKTARDVIGKELVSNIVALGATAKILEKKGLMKGEDLKKGVLSRVPKGTEEMNTKAFDAGFAMV